jgi:hypothetical protein
MDICGVGYDRWNNAMTRLDLVPETRHWQALKYHQENKIHCVDRRADRHTVDYVSVAFLGCNTEEKGSDSDFESACVQNISYFGEPPSLYCQPLHKRRKEGHTFNAAVR